MEIELSGVQFGLKSYAWFQKQMSTQHEVDLKSQDDFRPKLHDMRFKLPLYCIHFEIAQNTGRGKLKYFIDAVLSQSEIKFIHFLGGKSKSFGNKSCKICHMILFVFHFPAIWLVTLNKPWNLIGCFVFSLATSLAGKKMQFKAKNGAICE